MPTGKYIFMFMSIENCIPIQHQFKHINCKILLFERSKLTIAGRFALLLLTIHFSICYRCLLSRLITDSIDDAFHETFPLFFLFLFFVVARSKKSYVRNIKSKFLLDINRISSFFSLRYHSILATRHLKCCHKMSHCTCRTWIFLICRKSLLLRLQSIALTQSKRVLHYIRPLTFFIMWESS